MAPISWELPLAFDLLKLQIYQEALDTLKRMDKEDHVIGICLVVEKAVIDLCRIYDVTAIEEVTTDFERIMDQSMAIVLNYTKNTWYLWPLATSQTANRIKYLERLIEDEMSGTYFMSGMYHV